MAEPEARRVTEPLSLGRTVGVALLTLLVAGVGQMAATVAVGVATGRLDLSDPHAGERPDGLLVAAGIVGATSLALPMLVLLLRRRAPRDYLAVTPPPMPISLAWVVAGLLTLAVSQGANVLFGRPALPAEWRAAMANAGSPWFVVVALAVVAPLLEEAFFRGFLHRSIETLAARHGSQRGTVVSVAITSVLFALAHFPADALDALAGLLMGVVLGLARAHTGSIVTTYVMHLVVNGLTVGYLAATVA
jgi:membrane protease YdiL (CAAX protease family)